MRFVYTLTPVAKLPLTTEHTDDTHVYDKPLHDHALELREWCDVNEVLKNSYRRVVMILHPFEFITTYVTTRFIPNGPGVKATNAFMKMWETMRYLTTETDSLKIGKTLRLYDIAGAPGMFIFAIDTYLRRFYRGVNLDWYTCSLEADYALPDEFGLFHANPDRYQSCDVTKPEDIKQCMTKGKFQLVTGDIGIPHDYELRTLQEENQADIEWGQAILGLNLTETGGIMFLKMYTLLTYEAIYLLDTLTMYFDTVRVCKPYTSRVTNFESYLICIGRNDKDCSIVPLSRPSPTIPFSSPNISIMTQFESIRLEVKYDMLNWIVDKIDKNKAFTFKNAKEDSKYLEYFNEFRKLYNEVCHVGVHEI